MGILIEYQGEQHFKPKEFSKSTSKKDAILKLELQKKHDKMKMDFASKNNLTLLCPTFKFNSYSKVYNYLENVLYKK